SVSRDIRASSETVWNLLVDMDSWVEVIQAIEVVERLDAVPGFGVGTRWRETRTMFGKKA
ncbi:MAG TPA: carbon monoxide dehydrogenase, partial [Acidimicrobiaceae bacterium]|nr:carbon monoxide dehydrogenase [Acidimicrobiaceae bacterium]